MTVNQVFAIVIGLEALVVALALLLGYQTRRAGRLRAQVRRQADKVSNQTLALQEIMADNDELRDENTRLLELTIDADAP